MFGLLKQLFKDNSNKKITVLDKKTTLYEILNSNKSFGRFGDGEFQLALGKGIPFQEKNKKLSKKLKKLLKTNDKNFMIGFNYRYIYPKKTESKIVAKFIENFIAKKLPKFLKLCSKSVTYYDASVFLTYILEHDNCQKYFDEMKKLWENKDIVIVSGETVFDKIENNIFNCAKSIEYIKAPSVNAFNKYDEIISEVEKQDKSKLILLILGPTATVMAYDLYLKGYRAIDVGHIAKDYDFYIKKIELNDNNITDFHGID